MRIPKQKVIPGLGAFIDCLFTALPILSILNFISIQTVLYAMIVDYINSFVPWMNFGWFILLMVIITLAVMLFTYKFVIPSLWVWRGSQLYGHESVVMDEVKDLQEDIQQLKKQFEGFGKQIEALAKK